MSISFKSRAGIEIEVGQYDETSGSYFINLCERCECFTADLTFVEMLHLREAINQVLTADYKEDGDDPGAA